MEKPKDDFSPNPLTQEQVTDAESKFPEIVNFLRNSMDSSKPESMASYAGIQEQSKIEDALYQAMHGRVPVGMFRMFLQATQHSEYKDGIMDCFRDPDRSESIRVYVRRWFSARGVVFEYSDV